MLAQLKDSGDNLKIFNLNFFLNLYKNPLNGKFA